MVIFAPYVIAPIIIGIIWGYILNPNYGLVNSVLRKIGLDMLAIEWIGGTKWSPLSLAIVFTWQVLGFHGTIFLSGIKAIPGDIYEACVNRKRQNTMMVFGAVGADDMHIRILLHLFHCQRCQLILTLCDLLKTDSFDITDRFAQRIRACSVDGSRLEFMRHLSIGSPVRVTYSIISPPVRKGGIFPATPSCRTAHQFPSEPASYVRKRTKNPHPAPTH